jgi:2-amino-4-hydroxy-6-hydroxymethyldihydropteridine diphosphokinase
VGRTDQPKFLNLVAGIETTLTPEELLTTLQKIEHAFGRKRVERWGPRTLDLDLLVYESEKRDTPELTLPHPRMLERAFVTVPLREVLQRPRFQGGQWTVLRERLRVLSAAEHDVARFVE